VRALNCPLLPAQRGGCGPVVPRTVVVAVHLVSTSYQHCSASQNPSSYFTEIDRVHTCAQAHPRPRSP
jgi:hypothetical protein